MDGAWGSTRSRFYLNLKINRNAICKKRGGIKGQTSIIQIPGTCKGIQAIDNLATKIR